MSDGFGPIQLVVNQVSDASNLWTLLSIAALAQQLNIPLGRGPSFHHRNDMVKFEAFLAAALNALASIALPNESPYGLRDSFPPRRRELIEIIERFDLTTNLL